MYGQAKYSKSKYGNNMLIHEAGNQIYEYRCRKKFTPKKPKKLAVDQCTEQASIFYYVCNSCALLKNADKHTYGDNQLPTIRVKNNTLLNDPELLTHFCRPRTTGEHLAKQVRDVNWNLLYFVLGYQCWWGVGGGRWLFNHLLTSLWIGIWSRL